MANPAPAEAAAARPEEFRIDIASGVLVSLGLNMYTSIGKSLAEFVANSYDAEASRVDIAIPFADIDNARIALRATAKAQVAEGKRDKFTVLTDPLPDDVKIVITDNGHGMSPEDVEKKLLVVSRNRREGDAKSETGMRFVMGRKGLGKLAGFGTAEKITIWTKRAGETFATEFTMNYGDIEKQAKVHESFFKAVYHDGQPKEKKGTVITLSALRCDSLKASAETVQDALAQNFAMLGAGFAVYLNGVLVEETPAQFEFLLPEKGMATETVHVGDMLSFDIQYMVRFRAREDDANGPAPKDAKGRELKRGSLPTGLRGARIYCNGRLAAGPSMFKLHTGMHNFHAQAYMECIVNADELDRQSIDHIGTNRAELKGDSDVVEALKDSVTQIMQRALYEHSKFRDKTIAKQVEEDDFTKGLMTRTQGLSRDIQASTKKLLTTLANVEGVASPLYKSAAPLVLESMNAGEVLASLIHLETDPKSMVVVAHELLELARVENRDVLKNYRGRRSGIEAVRKLIEKSQASFNKGERFENELHQVLKANPWLIKPEFARHLTSDTKMADVALQLTKELEVDGSAPQVKVGEGGEIEDKDKRPDLVFLTIDASTPGLVTIVELKTPNYALRRTHLSQLEGYMMRVEKWLATKYPGRPIIVRGYLIGDVDPNSKVEDVQLLHDAMNKAGPQTRWEVIPLPELLERAKQIHMDQIEIAERLEEQYNEELSSERVPAKPAAKAAAANDPREEGRLAAEPAP